MDINQLITDLQEISQKNSISHYKRDRCAEAATALATFQAENAKLRAELEQKEKYYEQMVDALAATESTELEQVKRERDAAVNEVERVIERYVPLGPFDRLRELAQADREGEIPKYTIGDTIYDRFGNAWKVTAVERRLLAGEPKWIYRCGHIGTDDYFALWEFEVLTCEEAEAARREYK